MSGRAARLFLGLGALIAGGCAEENAKNMMSDPATGRSVAAAVTPADAPRSSAAFAADRSVAAKSSMDMGGGMGGRGEVEGQTTVIGLSRAKSGQPAEPPKADPNPRKILYTADIDLVVENFAQLESAVLASVRRSGGYIADADAGGAAGSNRTARWKIRIPIDKFDGFLDETSKLGELTRRQIHSQDVTEEYFDLEARIKNKKVEETRLLKHLQDSTGKLDEILSVEREVSRVREEIERQEGRLRLLANLAELTTITITAVERINYVPPTTPSFATRVARQFDASWTRLLEFGEGVILVVVTILPWLPVVLVFAIVILVIVRLLRRFGNRVIV